VRRVDGSKIVFVQNAEKIKKQLLKSHKNICEISFLFSIIQKVKRRAKKRENVNYKQNPNKKILYKNIILERMEKSKMAKNRHKSTILKVRIYFFTEICAILKSE